MLMVFVLFSFGLFAQSDLSLILSAKFYYQNQDYSKALQYVDSISDKTYYANYLEGQIYFQKGELPFSISSFKACNTVQAHYADYDLAKAYSNQGNIDSALYFLRQHLKSNYKKRSVDIKKEAAFKTMLNTEQWKQLSIDQFYTEDEKSLERAIYYRNKKEVDLALDILDDLISKNKNNTEALYYRAKFIIDLNQDYKYAISDLKKAIKIKKDNYAYYHQIASFYFHETKYKKALENYLLAYEVYPYVLQDYLNIAKAYYRTGDYVKAISFIEKYTNIDDKNVDALLLAGQVYYDKGDFENSIDYLTRAININPRRIDVLVARGKSYLENDQYPWAGRDFNIALDLDTQNGEIWYLKGLAFLYQDKRDEACKYFKKATYLNYYKADEYLLKECQ